MSRQRRPWRKLRLYPLDDFGLNLVQLANKKVVCVLDPDQLFWLGRSRHHSLNLGHWTVLVVIAADEKFGLVATWQISVGVVSPLRHNRQTQRNQAGNTRVATAGTHADVGPEGKSCKQNRTVKFVFQPIESGAHIILLSMAVVVHALASANAAKVKAQDGNSEAVQRLHRAIDHLVVQRASTHRVGMTDQCAVWRIFQARVQQRLQRTCRARVDRRIEWMEERERIP